MNLHILIFSAIKNVIFVTGFAKKSGACTERFATISGKENVAQYFAFQRWILEKNCTPNGFSH